MPSMKVDTRTQLKGLSYNCGLCGSGFVFLYTLNACLILITSQPVEKPLASCYPLAAKLHKVRTSDYLGLVDHKGVKTCG